MQNKITLALFLAGSTSALSGPRPVMRQTLDFSGKTIDLGTTTNELYTWSSTEIDVASDTDGSKYIAAVTEGTGAAAKTTGLYGCLRQGLVGLAPQKIDDSVTTSTLAVVDIVDADTHRVFYTQTDTANGVAPTHLGDQATTGNYATGATTAFPTMDTSGATGAAFAGDTNNVTAEAANDTVSGIFLECCKQSSSTGGYDLDDISTCVSLVPFVSGGVRDTSFFANRIAIFETLSQGIYQLNGADVLNAGATIAAATPVQSGYDKDFILGATGQRSDDGSDNWCDPKFAVGTTELSATDGQALTASAGFNIKTKCTWQLTADTDKAPQFELTSAKHSTFFIQWIDHSNDSSVVTDNTYLPQTVNTVLGKYVGFYWNPFVQGLVNQSATINAAAGASDVAHNQPYNEHAPTTTFTNNLDASIGHVNYFKKVGQNAQIAAENVDFNVFAIADAVMDSVYDTYSRELTDYNKLAETYNTAFTNFKTDNTVVIPPLPCPPTEPANGNMVEFEFDTGKLTAQDQFDELDGSLSNDTIYYVPLNTVDITTSAKAKFDNRRLGHLYTNVDFDVATSSTTQAPEYPNTDSPYSVGHVYGRLGQGDNNMPGVSDPWKFDEDDSSASIMDVSIFPEAGFGATPIAAGDEIILTASEAEFTTTPYVKASATSTLPTKTLNAVAMGVSVAALAVSASLF